MALLTVPTISYVLNPASGVRVASLWKERIGHTRFSTLPSLRAAATGFQADFEPRLLGSRRLHRWFFQTTTPSQLHVGITENHRPDTCSSTGSAPYVDLQPLVALMSKRRLTEYYFSMSLGTVDSTLEDTKSKAPEAEFLEEYLEGVPDVLDLPLKGTIADVLSLPLLETIAESPDAEVLKSKA